LPVFRILDILIGDDEKITILFARRELKR
jgi:hypothetical protein